MIFTFVVEAGSYIAREALRRHVYQSARCRADVKQKPLVVVGAPNGSRQYKCGDLPCVDRDGCDACGAGPVSIETKGAIAVPDGGAVVCAQYALEHTADIEAAWAEMTRAAGTHKNVFLARLRPFETWTRVATGARWIVDGVSNEGKLRYHAVRDRGRASVRGQGRRVV